MIGQFKKWNTFLVNIGKKYHMWLKSRFSFFSPPSLTCDTKAQQQVGREKLVHLSMTKKKKKKKIQIFFFGKREKIEPGSAGASSGGFFSRLRNSPSGQSVFLCLSSCDYFFLSVSFFLRFFLSSFLFLFLSFFLWFFLSFCLSSYLFLSFFLSSFLFLSLSFPYDSFFLTLCLSSFLFLSFSFFFCLFPMILSFLLSFYLYFNHSDFPSLFYFPVNRFFLYVCLSVSSPMFIPVFLSFFFSSVFFLSSDSMPSYVWSQIGPEGLERGGGVEWKRSNPEKNEKNITYTPKLGFRKETEWV